MAKKNDFGISLEDAVRELGTQVPSAVNFLHSSFSEDWEKAERYYAGETDLPTVPDRSKVVKTEVRDSIRAIKPSVMRTLLHARKIVEYVPKQLWSADFVEQQSVYATQLFWANNGYKIISNIYDECAKKKACPVKVTWEEDPFPEYFKATGLQQTDLRALEEAPDVEIASVEANTIPLTGETAYDVEWHKYYTNGRIRMEAFPITEFFISRNATCIEDATVHGHRRDVTVHEALELGLDHDDWMSLDSDDPEESLYSGESYERRRYQVEESEDLDSSDLANHKFLLTECYCSFDLDGTGNLQKYVFYLGGTNYEYLHHEKIEDWEIDLVQIDPVQFASIGHSIADLTTAEQDMNTSILRAITDNFHMSNNPRLAANPMLTDFSDLMNNSIGAPIKQKAGGEIQVIGVPFTGQQGLPLLQYLESDVQNKVGVTKAAQGLDPDAMQSTDKDAVRNTIMLAQGQVELMVRNIIETGLIPLFRKLLRLSVRHMDRMQLIRIKGMVIPLDQALLDPDLVAEPNVGLGTTSPEQKMQALLFILDKQETILQTYGFDNPFVGLSQVYNTLEDIVELSGFHDVGRFFNLVTPEKERLIAQQRQEAARQQEEAVANSVPMDPSKAMLTIESGKARIRALELTAEREKTAKEYAFKANQHADEIDLERDKLAQSRIIELLKLKQDANVKRADTLIKREQIRNGKGTAPQTNGSEKSGENTA